MSIFSICAFMGTGLGPAVSGYIELKKGWRWIEWVQVSPPAGLIPLFFAPIAAHALRSQMMFAGVMAVLIILFTRETRGSVILSRRARKMRTETGDPRYQCRSDAERASLAVLIRVSMTRPLCESSSGRYLMEAWLAWSLTTVSQICSEQKRSSSSSPSG